MADTLILNVVHYFASDPELKNGNLRIGCPIERKTKDGGKETTWINAIATGKTAENIAKFFKKGNTALLKLNDLHMNTYEGKTSLSCFVQGFDFLPGNARNADQGNASKGSGDGSNGNEAPAPSDAGYSEEDIPF